MPDNLSPSQVFQQWEQALETISARLETLGQQGTRLDQLEQRIATLEQQGTRLEQLKQLIALLEQQPPAPKPPPARPAVPQPAPPSGAINPPLARKRRLRLPPPVRTGPAGPGRPSGSTEKRRGGTYAYIKSQRRWPARLKDNRAMKSYWRTLLRQDYHWTDEEIAKLDSVQLTGARAATKIALMSGKWLSAQAAAKLVGCHWRTVVRAGAAGHIPGAYKVGNEWQIPRAGLKAWRGPAWSE